VSQPSRIRVLALALALAVPLGGAAAAPHQAAGSHAPRLVEIKRKPRPPRSRKKAVPLGERAARIALREVGTPYVWGGERPGGFDCSGLTSWVYGRLGVQLPHSAAAQFEVGRAVQRSRLRTGDLLFFHGLGHVGLYIGNGRMIHAPQSGQTVEIQALTVRNGAVEGARRLRS
jgi:peptidoglycan DL-endopeptidase CwlO